MIKKMLKYSKRLIYFCKNPDNNKNTTRNLVKKYFTEH